MSKSASRPSFLQSISRTLVSVELITDMRPSRSQRQASRRVILKASITSVILLSIAFIITYSVILTYVSNKVPLMRHQDSSSSEKSKSGKRTKLVARPLGVLNKEDVLKFVKSNVVKWNVKDYNDVTSKKPVCEKDSKVVILITSAPDNLSRRQSIRNTWCSPQQFNFTRTPWLCVFLLGNVVNRSESLASESLLYHDILLGSYVDSYRNLTIKIMHGLDWVRQSCPTDFVLKTDDDVYVNTLLLHTLVTNYTQPKNMYIGLVMQTESRLTVIRNPDNRWHVSMDEYPHDHYPPYASGMGYVLSLDVVNKIVDASQYISPFANEDAYVGVLINQVGVSPLRSGRFTLTGSGLRKCNLLYLVVIHHVSAEEQYDFLQTHNEALQTCHHTMEVTENMWS
ncbi:beta-1,3-galactosyltransferase 5-like [Mya arenaria]|uniref:beta-1,3-galactosyltransferase 5-like n=1 Tax=Mya arenaria TaxID=6604 RepID=UPI0022DEDDF2|nr:beta-1,3-galactosyltransferase 5-like [Mya arenaria]